MTRYVMLHHHIRHNLDWSVPIYPRIICHFSMFKIGIYFIIDLWLQLAEHDIVEVKWTMNCNVRLNLFLTCMLYDLFSYVSLHLDFNSYFPMYFFKIKIVWNEPPKGSKHERSTVQYCTRLCFPLAVAGGSVGSVVNPNYCKVGRRRRTRAPLPPQRASANI